MRPTLTREWVWTNIRKHSEWVAREIDAPLLARRQAGAAEGNFVACGMECSACCHLLVTVGAPDALRVAARLKGLGQDTMEVRMTLLNWHRKYCDSGCEPGRYKKAWIPCVFLVDNACSIYTSRPVVCRLANVIGSPCTKESIDGEHRTLMVADLKDMNTKASREFSESTWAPVFGTFPEMVVWALDELAFLEARDAAYKEPEDGAGDPVGSGSAGPGSARRDGSAQPSEGDGPPCLKVVP